jgi:hypothetical protein
VEQPGLSLSLKWVPRRGGSMRSGDFRRLDTVSGEKSPPTNNAKLGGKSISLRSAGNFSGTSLLLLPNFSTAFLAWPSDQWFCSPLLARPNRDHTELYMSRAN